jgi:dihydrofolate reductase
MSCHSEEAGDHTLAEDPIEEEEEEETKYIYHNAPVTIIVACTEHGGIAQKEATSMVTPKGQTVMETMPWRYTKEGDIDMRFFRKQTLNNTVIVGRKTYETFGGNPLPKRNNIVLGSEFNGGEFKRIDDKTLVMKLNSYSSAIPFASGLQAASGAKVFVIGGAEIYAKAIEAGCESVLLNVIPGKEYDDKCDLKFPLEQLLNNYLLVECNRLWDSNEEHLQETALVLSTRWTRLKTKGVPVPTNVVPLDSFTVVEWGEVMSIVNSFVDPTLQKPEMAITKFLSLESALKVTGFAMAFIGVLIESSGKIKRIQVYLRTPHTAKAIEAYIDNWTQVLKVIVNESDLQLCEYPREIKVLCEEATTNSGEPVGIESDPDTRVYMLRDTPGTPYLIHD